MSRKIYDEDLRLNLILNGEGLNQGSKKMVAELGKMEQEMVKMEQQAKQLALSIKNLEKNSTANAVQLKQQKADYGSLNQAMKAHQLQIEDMRKQVGLAGMTVEQLRNHLNALKVQLFNMPGSAGSPMFKQLQAEITETEIRLRTLTTGASRMAQAWERLEKAANRAGTILGWAAVVIYGIVRVVTGVIDRMKELEDLVGSVRKNTNLVVGEVWDMKDAFDKWDTRTKTDDLMQMAIVAGKLGVEGKENIMDFVDSANKIQIALGDDLQGSAEDTVNSIGKLTNAFRTLYEIDDKTGKKFTLGAAMMRTGDVLNQLAKSSAASAGTILEYMTRLAGVSELAGFTIAQVGGLGSVLDALNVPSERGATALQKIMLQLANPKKIQDFADAMGLVGNATQTAAVQYEALLKKDPNMVFTTLIEKFVSTKSGLVELTGGFKDFGVRGQYMTAVLGALAQNLDVVKEQQAIANKAWKDGTSILSEYNIMNNNFTAEVLKQQKVIRAQTDHMNKEAEPAVLWLVTAWAKLIVVIRETTDLIGRHWQAIKNITFAYIALNAPTIYRISLLGAEKAAELANIVIKELKIFWMKAELLYLLLLTKGTAMLTIEQEALMLKSKLLTLVNIAMTKGLQAAILEMRAMMVTAGLMSFPLVALAATIAVVAGAFYLLVLKKKELSEVEKKDIQTREEIRQSYAKEQGALNILLEQLKNANISQEERSRLLKQIQDQYGEYLPSLKKEGLTVEDVVKSYDKLIDAMGRKLIHDRLISTAEENNAAMILKREELDKKQKELDDKIAQKPSDIYTDKFDRWRREKVILEDQLHTIGTTYTELYNLDTKYKTQLNESAPPPRAIVAPAGFKTKDEGVETFKQRQAAMKSAFEEEELAIKEHALATNQTAEQENEALRQAKIRYLRLSIEDREASWRTEDSEQAAYMSARKELLDIERQSQLGAAKEVTKENKLTLKDAREFGQELIDVEKLRIDTITNDREKSLAEEDNRHIQAMAKHWKNDEALDYEEIIHNQNVTDINLKFLDKQLADKTLNYTQREILLEDYWKKELITDDAYWTIKAQLNKDKQTGLEEFKKQYGLLSMQQTVDIEISAMKSNAFWALLTEEEKEKAIDAIRLKYGRKRAQTLKKNLDTELNDIKEKFTAEQQMAFENGTKQVTVYQTMGDKITGVFSEMFAENQNAMAVFGKQMLLIALDFVKAEIRLQYPLILAKQIASKGPLAGAVAAAGSIAMIEAGMAVAFGIAQALIGKINTSKQKAEGSYPVIGSDDGRLYNATYGGSPRTGVYSQPTLLNMSDGRSLVGERAPELVVDGDTFRRIQLNAPGLLQDIYAYAGRGTTGRRGEGAKGQYAGGSYPTARVNDGTTARGGGAENFVDRFDKMIDRMELLYKKPLSINKFGHNGINEAYDDLNKFNRLTK